MLSLSIFSSRELILSASSRIIEDIDAMRKQGLASLAFFYHDFREIQKTDLRGLLSSVLFQLCSQSDSYCDILSDFYLTHRDVAQIVNDELVRCLKDVLEVPEQAPVFLIRSERANAGHRELHQISGQYEWGDAKMATEA